MEKTQGTRLIGHIARDSTAIPAREHFALAAAQLKREEKKKQRKVKGRRHPKGSLARAKPSERGSRIQRQRHQELDKMLADLPRQCDIGGKKNARGDNEYWRGYKLHLDVAEGQIPISAILTSASVHVSQVAIPLMTQTSQRVTYLYDLMDSAYNTKLLHEHGRQLNHVPIIAIHPRRGAKKPSPLTKTLPAQPTPQMTWAQQERYNERTMSERVKARLKDEFGATHLRVRGAATVMAHLMFGVVALTVDQWLRFSINRVFERSQ